LQAIFVFDTYSLLDTASSVEDESLQPVGGEHALRTAGRLSLALYFLKEIQRGLLQRVGSQPKEIGAP
jgi:hypothetical protein